MKPKLFLTAFLIAWLMASPGYSAFDSNDFASEKPLKITRVTPDGEDVPAEKQIVIQFNRPVVPLGRMERTAEEIPVEIDQPLKCEWRWLNTSALACRLGEKDALKPSTRYKVTINPGIKAEDGTTIAATFNHQLRKDQGYVMHGLTPGDLRACL